MKIRIKAEDGSITEYDGVLVNENGEEVNNPDNSALDVETVVTQFKDMQSAIDTLSVSVENHTKDISSIKAEFTKMLLHPTENDGDGNDGDGNKGDGNDGDENNIKSLSEIAEIF